MAENPKTSEHRESSLGEAFDKWLATTTIRGKRELIAAKAAWIMGWNEGRDSLSEQEQCSYCRQYYPKPVSLHHTTEECSKNQHPRQLIGTCILCQSGVYSGEPHICAGRIKALTQAATQLTASSERLRQLAEKWREIASTLESGYQLDHGAKGAKARESARVRKDCVNELEAALAASPQPNEKPEPSNAISDRLIEKLSEGVEQLKRAYEVLAGTIRVSDAEKALDELAKDLESMRHQERVRISGKHSEQFAATDISPEEVAGCHSPITDTLSNVLEIIKIHRRNLADPSSQPAAPEPSERTDYKRLSVMLYRSLERLSIAIAECGRIGFEESKHFDIWMDLNNAQADAKLKLKHCAQFVAAPPPSGVGGPSRTEWGGSRSCEASAPAKPEKP